MKDVADLMTPAPLCVRGSVTVRTALLRMRGADVRHLPVVDAHGRLIGFLSDRDLLRAEGAPGGGDRKVEEVMTTDVLTVRPTTLASEVSALMLDRKIGAVPVSDDRGQVVGIVTETDFLRIAHEALGGV
jgi:CBS domain-containing protein